MKTWLIALACWSVAACATPYQEMGLTGGVQATRITEDTLQVIARGNAYTDPSLVQRYTLRKAAEETIAAGFDTFRVVSDADASQRGASGVMAATGSQRSIFGSSSYWDTLKPGQTVMVKMFKGPRPSDAPSDLYDAREVVRFAEAAERKKLAK